MSTIDNVLLGIVVLSAMVVMMVSMVLVFQARCDTAEFSEREKDRFRACLREYPAQVCACIEYQKGCNDLIQGETE